MIVSAKHLKKCVLWYGSSEELDFNFGGLKLAVVKKKIESLQRCPDRTPNEDEYLQALIKTEQEAESHHE